MIRGINHLVLSVCVLVLSGVYQVNAGTCPTGQVERKLESQDETVCCEPYFNCGPGNEIVSCTGPENNKDVCVPCAATKTTFHFTSSVDESWTKYRCFEKDTPARLFCPPEDTRPTAEMMFENCALSCECDVSKCYYGIPCGCTYSTPCIVGNELNIETGECNPCKKHMYKDNLGCLPCLWNETSWRLSQGADIPAPNDPSDEDEAITHNPSEVKTTDGGKYVIETGDKETASSSTTDTDAEEGGAPVALIIIIILFVVLGAVLIALVLFLEKKIRDEDHASGRLVVYYKKLRCKKGTQTPLDDDVEHGQGDENNGDVQERPLQAETNGDVQEKPQQAVPPMPQEKTAVAEVDDEIPFAEMSLNVTNEQTDSMVPLMSAETNGDVTVDATEQKKSP